MTTLHDLRRKHALLFSQLAHETGISTRRLAAYEYHGDTLAPHEQRTLATYFGVLDDFLEGGCETAHIAPRARWLPVKRLGTQLQGTIAAIAVIVAASLWASLGLFYRVLAGEYGLQEVTIVAYGAGIAAIVLFAVMALVRPALLVVRRQDWLYFLLFGVVGEAAFYLCYVQATLRGPLAVAAVLQYTSAIWIMLWAVLRHGERLTMRKGLVLGVALCGCTLVAGGWQVLTTQLNGMAIGFGLLAGLSYAVYSLCSAAGTRRGYHTWTVVAYSLGIGAVLLFALQPLDVSLRPLRLPGAWPYLLGAALGPTLVAPLCFTYGVRYIRPSSASILAMVEPVVAAILGWLVVVPSEPLSGSQLVGGGTVVIAVSLLDQDRLSSVLKQQLGHLRKLFGVVRRAWWYA